MEMILNFLVEIATTSEVNCRCVSAPVHFSLVPGFLTPPTISLGWTYMTSRTTTSITTQAIAATLRRQSDALYIFFTTYKTPQEFKPPLCSVVS